MVKISSYRFRVWLVILTLLCPSAASLPATADNTDRFVGTVLFMRHALAPGFGDPDDFSIKDCSTQRNLNKIGRSQAQAIGVKLAAANIKFSGIYSSYWCRCVETAKLLDLGAITPFDGLNSFFQNHVPREPEAVIDQLGIFRHELVLEMRGTPVERGRFHRAVGGKQDGAARGLVDTA